MSYMLSLPRARTSEYTRVNPPGLPALAYRAGVYSTVLQRLLEELAAPRPSRANLPALRLDIDASQNWAIGLLEAWAMVIDVLTFYQERIINEGYLGTATELFSLLQICRSIGYEQRPGLAASTYLAFTVYATRDDPRRRSFLPRGMAVQSVPTLSGAPSTSSLTRLVPANMGGIALSEPIQPAALPQTFETSQEFEARAEWNALRPLSIPQAGPSNFDQHTSSLRLAGNKTGLHAGDPLLIISGSSPDQQRYWKLVFLKTAEPDLKKDCTLVTWDNAAEENADHLGNMPLQRPQILAFGQHAQLYGYPPGGIHVTSLADNADWSPACIGLPSTEVHALLLHPAGGLFAGTDEGVFRSANRGESWEAVNAGLLRAKIYALTVDVEGKIYAGSATGGLFGSIDLGNTWQPVRWQPPRGIAAMFAWFLPKPLLLSKSVIRALTVYRERQATCLVAAQAEGVFVSKNGGLTWKRRRPASSDPASRQRGGAWTFAASEQGQKPFVGMDTGVFPLDGYRGPVHRLEYAALIGLGLLVLLPIIGLVTLAITTAGIPDVWLEKPPLPPLPNLLEHIPLALYVLIPSLAIILLGILLWYMFQQRHTVPALGQAVHALAVSSAGHLLAGTKQGIYLSTDKGRHWSQVSQGSDVRALTGGAQESFFAGTQDGRVLRSQDGGGHWDDFSQNLELRDLRGFVSDAQMLFAAGLPPDQESDDQWSHFQLQRGQIDLDRLYAPLAPGSWIALRQGNQVAVNKVVATTSVQNPNFRKGRNFSRLQVDRPATSPGRLPRSSTGVLMQSEALALYDDEPLSGENIPCDTFVPGLTSGQRMIVSGKRIRLRLVNLAPTAAMLVSTDGLRQTALDTGDTFLLLAAPSSPENQRWLLRERNGFIGYLTASASSIRYESAAEDDEYIGELIQVKAVAQGDKTTIMLNRPLQNTYDKATVTLYANVVHATQGQTVSNEVLGEISGQQKIDRFTLKQKPLTYLSSAGVSGGSVSTLAVRVNGISWREISSPLAFPNAARSYLVRQDDQNNTTLIFNQSAQRSPLPGGTGQITATYRVGSGHAGNVLANSLTVLRNRPAGIQAVTNPLPASGGTDASTLEQARADAPRQIATLQRIVSLADYEHFARTFAGIGKAQISKVYTGKTTLLLLTLAGTDGAEVASGSDLYDHLLAALNAAVVSPLHYVSLSSFEPLYFQVQATLVINADRASRKDALLLAATGKLRAAFGFAQRELGQAVSASEVIALLQQVEGVNAVYLERLALNGQQRQPEPFNTLLTARTGRIEQGILKPAQMLLLDPDYQGGITLQLEGEQADA